MTIFKLRRGTTAQWAAPTQGAPKTGELVYNSDTDEVKLGDGSTAFASLENLKTAWSRLTGKPAVIAAGADQAAARTAIGAAPGPFLHTDFSTKPDSAGPTVGDEGVATTLLGGSSGYNDRLIVKDGLLQAPAITGVAGDRAGYWNQPLAKARRVGATFKFSTTADDATAVGLIIWSAMPTNPFAVPTYGPIHLSLTPNQYVASTVEGGVLSTSWSGAYGTGLTCDWDPAVAGSGTLYRAEVLLVDDTLAIALPDGSTAVITDSRFKSLDAAVICVEVFRNSTTTGYAAIESLWADNRSAAPGGSSLGLIARLIRATDKVVFRSFFSPIIDLIWDANKNEMLSFSSVASAVNYLRIANAITGNGPIIFGAGDDATVDVRVQPKNAPTGKLKVYDGSAFVPVSARATTTSTGAYTLPAGSDSMTFVNTTANQTLPAASSANAGCRHTLRNIQASADMNINTTGGQTIDINGTTYTSMAVPAGQSLTLASDGANYRQV